MISESTSSKTRARPSIRSMSISAPGRASRRFIIGTRLCPPAITFASGSSRIARNTPATSGGRT
ncbi:MAG TPA: hypothetical protein VGL93_36395 [Streptosporangiaceae bacterium]|jgi:hypothetical protein